jgi:hypothetical protein
MTRAVGSPGSPYVYRPAIASRLIAQMKADSSRAIAVAMTLGCLPFRVSDRKRPHNLICAFQRDRPARARLHQRHHQPVMDPAHFRRQCQRHADREQRGGGGVADPARPIYGGEFRRHLRRLRRHADHRSASVQLSGTDAVGGAALISAPKEMRGQAPPTVSRSGRRLLCSFRCRHCKTMRSGGRRRTIGLDQHPVINVATDQSRRPAAARRSWRKGWTRRSATCIHRRPGITPPRRPRRASPLLRVRTGLRQNATGLTALRRGRPLFAGSNRSPPKCNRSTGLTTPRS